MDSNSVNQTEIQVQEPLSVIELEERHEMTAVAGDMDRCSGNSGTVEKQELSSE